MSDVFHIAARYQSIMRREGIDAERVFSHPLIKPWRTLDDRENCTLDASLDDDTPIRLHVKRYKDSRVATDEVEGFKLLAAAAIPTAPLAGWGKLADGRGFVITEDLAGYRDSEKLVASGTSFDRLLKSTADLAGKLHRAGLHHRDLYLCHFFARVDEVGTDMKLIDVARVKRLPAWFNRRRWIVKDLAQFWYSTLKLPISDEHRQAWLEHYSGDSDVAGLRRSIERKAARIARHDARLTRVQPGRNVSIP